MHARTGDHAAAAPPAEAAAAAFAKLGMPGWSRRTAAALDGAVAPAGR